MLFCMCQIFIRVTPPAVRGIGFAFNFGEVRKTVDWLRNKMERVLCFVVITLLENIPTISMGFFLSKNMKQKT